MVLLVHGVLAVNTDVPGTTTYTFTPDAGQCATTTTLTITVNPLVTPTFTAVDNVCQNAVLLLHYQQLPTMVSLVHGAPAVNTAAPEQLLIHLHRMLVSVLQQLH